MQRFLVIRGGAIGDFVLTLPAIRQLRLAYPQARCEILGQPRIAALAEKRFYADAIRSLESPALARFFVADAELPATWWDYFGSFDLILSYLSDPGGVFARNLRRAGARNLLIGSPHFHKEEHAARQLGRPLAALGLTLDDGAAQLFPSETDRAFARRFLPDQRTLAFHPGSGSPAKNWPLEEWVRLIELCLHKESDRPLLLVGGEADLPQLMKLRAGFADRVQIAQDLPLPELAAVLERCAVFVGHDSGPSHLAAAVGTKCLLLFGPTSSAVWAPANSTVHVLSAPSGDRLDSISVDAVAEAIEHHLG